MLGSREKQLSQIYYKAENKISIGSMSGTIYN